MSRVTISREIAKLQNDGVLTKDRRDIIVLDPEGLHVRMPAAYTTQT
jgi:hypothetical protein